MLFVVLLVPTILILKWALGIFAIEHHLKIIEREITSKEDTIFSYKYDYYLPILDKESEVLRDNGIEESLEELVMYDYEEYFHVINALKMNKNTGDNEAEAIEKARSMLKSPVARTFIFSAAEDTEVILVYELKCFSPDGNRLQDPIGFNVQVNKSDVGPLDDGWEGKVRLNWDTHLSDVQPIIETRSNHMLYEQTLKLNLFYREKQGKEERRQDLARRLSGKIERCSFDAMIFVRDELSVFEAKGFISYLYTYLKKEVIN